MFDRINLVPVFRGHWKGLRDREGATIVGPDLVARGLLLLATGGVLAYSFVLGLELKAPGTLFAGLSLLSSGLLAAFAQIASIRSRYVVPDDPEFDSEIDTRNMLDEAVAHVLAAAVLAATAAVVIIIGMNWDTKGEQRLNTPFSTLVAGLGTYLFVLFLMSVRKLYAAYVLGNDVSKELSGHHRGS